MGAVTENPPKVSVSIDQVKMGPGCFCVLGAQLILLIFLSVFMTTEKNDWSMTGKMVCEQISFCDGSLKCADGDGRTGATAWLAQSPEWRMSPALEDPVKYLGNPDAKVLDIYNELLGSFDNSEEYGCWVSVKAAAGADHGWRKIEWESDGLKNIADQIRHAVLWDAYQTKFFDAGVKGSYIKHLFLIFGGYLPFRSLLLNSQANAAGAVTKWIVLLFLAFQMAYCWSMLWRGAMFNFFVPDNGTIDGGTWRVALLSTEALIVSLGALVDIKLSMVQLTAFSALHTMLSSATWFILYFGLQVVDFYGCLSVHMFGAVFGVFAARCFAARKEWKEEVETTWGGVYSLIAITGFFVSCAFTHQFGTVMTLPAVLVGTLFGAVITGQNFVSSLDAHRALIANWIVFSAIEPETTEKLWISAYLLLVGFFAGCAPFIFRHCICRLLAKLGLYDHSGVLSLHFCLSAAGAFFALMAFVIPFNFNTYSNANADVCLENSGEWTWENAEGKADKSECGSFEAEGECTMTVLGGFPKIPTQGVAKSGATAVVKTANGQNAADMCASHKLRENRMGTHPMWAVYPSYADVVKATADPAGANFSEECRDKHANVLCAPFSTGIILKVGGSAIPANPLVQHNRGASRTFSDQAGFQFAAIIVAAILGGAGGLAAGILSRVITWFPCSDERGVRCCCGPKGADAEAPAEVDGVVAGVVAKKPEPDF